MRKLFSITIFLFFSVSVLAQAGKYAGVMKKLVGKSFADSRNISGLSGWTFREGNVISPAYNPEIITVDIFQKGTTYVVLFNIKEDTTSKEFEIKDVLEIKNVSNNQQVKSALCKEGETDNPEIVALIKPGKTEFSKALKSWRFNRDKRKIEIKSIKLIKCLNEGFDQS